MAMFAAIAAIMRIPNAFERDAQLAAIGPYRSRGKGRAKAFGKTRVWRNHCNNGGTGRPHQSKRECERRLRQMARKAA